MPSDQTNYLSASPKSATGHGYRERFELGLDAMLAGLVALSDAERAQAR